MIINKYTVWLVLAVIIFCAGLAAGVCWLAPALTTNHITTVERQPVIIEGKTITETKLAYVPGETIYLPTPTAENPQATTATKLDGKFDIGKPTFTYMVNGKPGQFTKTDDERYIFDKNEIALTQTSTINIKAEIPVVDKTKNGAIGIGVSNHGVAGTLTIKNIWGYADKDTKALGLQYRF